MTEEQREIGRKKRVIEYAERNGNIKTACRRFGIARSTFYLWPLAGSVPRVGRRAVHTHRYEKQVPGHHVQVDVKFLTLKRKRGGSVRRGLRCARGSAVNVKSGRGRHGPKRESLKSSRNGRICLIRSVVVRTLPIGGAEKGPSFSYSLRDQAA